MAFLPHLNVNKRVYRISFRENCSEICVYAFEIELLLFSDSWKHHIRKNMLRSMEAILYIPDRIQGKVSIMALQRCAKKWSRCLLFIFKCTGVLYGKVSIISILILSKTFEEKVGEILYCMRNRYKIKKTCFKEEDLISSKLVIM